MTAPVLDPRLQALEELRWHVGNSPLHAMLRLSPKPGVEIHAKLEWQQFGGSVKARPAFNIIHNAVVSGALKGKRLLDASSGNTGIAYAIFAAAAGIPITLCVPENASKERKHILRALGVDLRLTSPFEGTDGAQAEARELVRKEPNKFCYVDQYGNEANWKAHYYGTGLEVWHETAGRITHFIAGLGTTGTFMGTGRRLKELNPAIRLIALQPETALHGLEGWKHLETARVPEIYDPGVPDEMRFVTTEESYHMMRRAAREEGLILSPSAGANLAGALALAEEIEEGVIVTILADDATKYSEVIAKVL
ncbi:MAG TPA: pyridoxal-phosphate dependent enzyme [Flavobacteriales bacterium]|nr:pyridoxal-phosphate dependent enzyme [Flavobacteriales bacterium]HIB76803.1 pyridoxal-phosphate dependent enzyme [Flavobacteriales bacterium]HIN41004.1 pyridoxal-phosphate dependent enzyme [Flavobacteriales bacterium]HIO15560.1 pyridoxal-phosphate dependent enzyme [Flavobacteriales bacterium]